MKGNKNNFGKFVGPGFWGDTYVCLSVRIAGVEIKAIIADFGGDYDDSSRTSKNLKRDWQGRFYLSYIH